MTLEHAVNNLNTFDVKEGNYVIFYSTEAAKKSDQSTVILRIQDEYIQVMSSRSLPTNGWKEHAKAYGRAEEFLVLSGLKDSR